VSVKLDRPVARPVSVDVMENSISSFFLIASVKRPSDSGLRKLLQAHLFCIVVNVNCHAPRAAKVGYVGLSVSVTGSGR
jgi:hypothetical protein